MQYSNIGNFVNTKKKWLIFSPPNFTIKYCLKFLYVNLLFFLKNILPPYCSNVYSFNGNIFQEKNKNSKSTIFSIFINYQVYDFSKFKEKELYYTALFIIQHYFIQQHKNPWKYFTDKKLQTLNIVYDSKI